MAALEMAQGRAAHGLLLTSVRQNCLKGARAAEAA